MMVSLHRALLLGRGLFEKRAALVVAAALVCAMALGCPARSVESGDNALRRDIDSAPLVKFSPRISLAPSEQGGKAVFGQGQVFMVTVRDETRLIASVRALWKDQTIPCLPDAGRVDWRGLGGIDKSEDPGSYNLDVYIETTDGRRLTVRTEFNIVKTDFSFDELTVAPGMATIPPEIQSRVQDDRRAFRLVWANPSLGRMWEGPFHRPAPGRITATYGEKRVFNGAVNSVHGGVDMAAPQGSPIESSAAGRVVLVRDCYIEGGTVVVDHGGGLFTYYCHLSGFDVEVGDMVEKGDVVGFAGSTGRVTGPHLHWGCRVQGVKVDGLSLLELEPWLIDRAGQ